MEGGVDGRGEGWGGRVGGGVADERALQGCGLKQMHSR